MAQTGRAKGVSYYFRLEFNTIQGKITTGFVLLGVFAIILMATSTWILSPALKKSQHIVNVLQPTNNQLLLLTVNAERVTLLSRDAILKDNALKIAHIESSAQLLTAPLDSLQQLSKHWQTAEAHLLLKTAQLKAATLIAKLKDLGTAPSQEAQLQLLDSDIVPLQALIQQQASTIQRLNQAEQEYLQEIINQRSDNIFWILSLSFIFSVGFGSAFASFVVLQVLKQIRMLKGKILEVSEGKLIEPIPNSKNELNSIIKAVNTLTDNLHNIQQFAKEVGKGNFDTNIQVFNGENDLGQSLAGMRDSLKSVAQEEKHRNWVATGIARFADLFRTSTDDLNSYYQTIISELVRYLDVNQAAIYIATDTESKRPQLELKACYAYGRLKHEQKLLEAGQGMVGQVFLEKKPLFLNNIPMNFLQITSGLGEASPRYLAVVPLKVNDEVNGVLEIASFHELQPYQIEFLLKVAENLSGALYNVLNVQTTARLLEEAQAMAQAMQSQEEMLRQNSEELIATQEKLSRDLQEMEGKLQLYEQALGQGTTPTLLVNQEGYIETANSKAYAFFGRTSLSSTHISELLKSQELMNMLTTTVHQPQQFRCHYPQKGELVLISSTLKVYNQSYLHLQIFTPETALLA